MAQWHPKNKAPQEILTEIVTERGRIQTIGQDLGQRMDDLNHRITELTKALNLKPEPKRQDSKNSLSGSTPEPKPK